MNSVEPQEIEIKQIAAAEAALARYDFGDGISISQTGRWNCEMNDGKVDYTMVLSAECTDDPEHANDHAVSFHVKFDPGTIVIDEAYAYWMETGADIGQLPEPAEKPKAHP